MIPSEPKIPPSSGAQGSKLSVGHAPERNSRGGQHGQLRFATSKHRNQRWSAKPVYSRAPVGLAFGLLLVVYPLLMNLGTFPLTIRGHSVSTEFVFSILCAVVVVGNVIWGSLKIAPCNGLFLVGMVIWLGANVVSLIRHPEYEANALVFRLLLKALFGCMVFLVLLRSGRLKMVLWAYVTGCAITGLFSFGYWAQTGDLNALREASFVGLNPEDVEVDLFRGVARMGASNLLPLWLCIVLYVDEPNKRLRTVLLSLLPYFAVLSLLALRREVLVEVGVGLMLLFIAAPRKYRLLWGVVGFVLVCCMSLFVIKSERWKERLAVETLEQFAAGEDPRMVLLINTPKTLMEEPILGHGPGSYLWVMSKYLPFQGEMRLGAHNSFSRAAVETGIVGLLGFTLMVGAFAWNLIRLRGHISSGSSSLGLASLLVLLHVGDWIFFGDGVASNTTWFFLGVLLYLDRCLMRDSFSSMAGRQRATPVAA